MSKKRWGALPGDWSKFIELGLVADVLPVVSNPNAEIDIDSSMKKLGKTPSRYNANRFVVGIGKWTERTSTMTDVKRWSREPDYGICLQTRNVRAIDIDIADEDLAHDIINEIESTLGFSLPVRSRSNSGKRLAAFALVGEHPKRKLDCGENGIIEFLGNGQQFIAAGTHDSGVQYEWSTNLSSIPSLTVNEFEAVWYALEEKYAVASHSSTALRNKKLSNDVVTDATVQALEAKGLVIGYGQEGQAHIDCPWKDQHTLDNGPTQTAYFPAGSRGYEQGHFVCLHAHCTHRSDEEFEDAFGLRMDEFECLPDLPKRETLPDKRLQFDMVERGNKLLAEASIDNVKLALERPGICGYRVCYDNFRGEIIFFDGKDENKWVSENDNIFVELRRFLQKERGFERISKELMRDTVGLVASQNTIDTAIEWLEAQQWDGTPRVDTFLSVYMGAEDSAYTQSVARYMWSAMAGRALVPGIQADMVPVLKSPEGYKKTTAIAALVPTPEQFAGIALDEKDDDRARKLRGVLVSEIEELRGLKTKDNESVKAFITRKAEKWVPKYKEFASTYLRRCLFIATTNEEQLFMPGANRRWLPVETTKLARVDLIERDRAQLWAEARELFKKNGVCWQDAQQLSKGQRDRYIIRPVYEDVVRDWLAREDDMDGGAPGERPYLRTIDVAREALNLDVARINSYHEKQIGEALRALGYERSKKWVGGKAVWVWTPDYLNVL